MPKTFNFKTLFASIVKTQGAGIQTELHKDKPQQITNDNFI